MIKCPKCGADNLLTSIFCHSCGAKLDLDDAAPEKEMAREAASDRKKKLIRKAGKIFVAIVIIGLLGLLFLPMSVSEKSLPEGEEQKIAAKWDFLQSLGANERYVISISAAEGEWIANEIVGAHPDTAEQTTASDQEQEPDAEAGEETEGEEPTTEEDTGFQILSSPRAYIELRDSNYMRVTMRYKLLQFVPLFKSVVVHLSVPEGEDPELVVEPTSARIGAIPLPGPLKTFITGWMAGVFQQNSGLVSLQGKIQDITVTEEQIKVTTGNSN